MLPRRTSTDVKHRRYRCTVCGKEDRKGRLIGHVLKYHIPMDRVPFSCSLCNFRCTDKPTLVNHLNSYKRHKEEVLRSGITDLTSVLNKAENPIDAAAMISSVEVEPELPEFDFADIDSSIFEPQDPEEPILPDWLDMELPLNTPPAGARAPTQLSCNIYGIFPTSGLTMPTGNAAGRNAQSLSFTTPNRFTTATRAPLAANPFLPNRSMVQPLYRTHSPIVTSTVTKPVPPALSFDSQLYMPSFGQLPVNSLKSFASANLPVTSSLPYNNLVNTTTSISLSSALTSTPQAPLALFTPTLPPSKSTPDHTCNTPLQDETEYLLDDILDGTYTSDPLFQEGSKLDLNKQSPKKVKTTTTVTTLSTDTISTASVAVTTLTKSSQTTAPAPSEDILNNILMAINSNGREMHAMNRNLRSVLDEVHNLHGAFISLERTCAPRNYFQRQPAPLPRSRQPLSQRDDKRKNTKSPEKENMKSVVKKARKN